MEANARSQVAQLSVYWVRWISGGKEGSCRIRATDPEDAITAFETEPSLYGVPRLPALVVLVTPERRLIRRIHGRTQP